MIVVKFGADLTKLHFYFQGQEYMNIDYANTFLLRGIIGSKEFTFSIVVAYQYQGNNLIPMSWILTWTNEGNNYFKLSSMGQ